MAIHWGITLQSEAFWGEKQNYFICIYFVLTENHPAGRETPLDATFLDQHMHTHNYTLWQCWQANNWNFLLLEKAHHHINGWTDKIIHIFCWGPNSQYSNKKKITKRKSQFFITCFFSWFFSNSLFTPLLSWHVVIHPRQVLNINQAFLLWNMIICKLVIIGTEKMWAAKWLV